jgi:hypothetical protein
MGKLEWDYNWPFWEVWVEIDKKKLEKKFDWLKKHLKKENRYSKPLGEPHPLSNGMNNVRFFGITL